MKNVDRDTSLGEGRFSIDANGEKSLSKSLQNSTFCSRRE
jgi:hypothetical protein